MLDAKVCISKRWVVLGAVGCLCVGLTVGVILGGALLVVMLADVIVSAIVATQIACVG